jgi:penicillin-binding protein 1A
MARYVIRIARQAGIAILFVVAAVLGIASGVLFAYAGDLPQISALDDYAPSTITRVYASGGEVIGEFAIQRRMVIGYDDIAPQLRNAIIAAEDAEFSDHFGLSISRIFVTLARDLLERRKAAGASTLTQQLARNLFPVAIGFEKTWERKIKEAIVAIQIEKRFTKREILTLYCNHIHFGHGTYGVEAASRLYFDKRARDLTLEEAALIAGIIQTPARQSPFVDEARASRRRDYVLQRMLDEGYITREQAEAARAKPLGAVDRRRHQDSPAPYFLEEVRKYLENKYGAKVLYEGGLSVHTSLDLRLQQGANRAVDEGVRAVDHRRGFRRPARNVLAAGGSVAAFEDDRWKRPFVPGDIVPAVVASVERDRARLRIGRYAAELTKSGTAWTGRAPADLLRPGDVVQARILSMDEAAHTAAVGLEQEPRVEGALLAIDNQTGQIRAMVGGYSFERSKFNRATQAERQLGSTFKAVVYTAAIDRGYTPLSSILDAPVSYPTGPGQPPYAPMNYDHTFEGPVTLRRALEKSRNVPTVRLMEQLGPKQVVAYARRFGFQAAFPPYLSLALGAGEATLVEVTNAYSVFPNQGVRMRPYFVLEVTDREGNVLEENRPEPTDAIRADTAYVMTSLLRGVVQRGTAARAASLDWPLAGKTGTVDDFTDAWFVGFDPDLTAGVWVGYDEKKPLGRGEDGARAALPIWMDFMKHHIDGRTDPPEFSPPGNIVFLRVDRTTGAPAAPDAPDAVNEAFISGTQPGTTFPR